MKERVRIDLHHTGESHGLNVGLTRRAVEDLASAPVVGGGDPDEDIVLGGAQSTLGGVGRVGMELLGSMDNGTRDCGVEVGDT